MATEHLELYYEANHGIHGVSRDKLQKLEYPVLLTGCSQQDFRFFREEWGRYARSFNVTEENVYETSYYIVRTFHCDNWISHPSQDDCHGAQIEKAAVERQSDPLNKTCANTPIQERVYTEKRDKYSDNIDKM